MRPCRFHPAALEEADNAAAFYKAQQPDLEVRFLEALNDAVSRIRSNPFLYRCVAGDVRKCRIVQFAWRHLPRWRKWHTSHRDHAHQKAARLLEVAHLTKTG